MSDAKKYYVQIPRDGAVVFFTSTEENQPNSCYEISEYDYNNARVPTGNYTYRVYDGAEPSLPIMTAPEISLIDRIVASIHKVF